MIIRFDKLGATAVSMNPHSLWSAHSWGTLAASVCMFFFLYQEQEGCACYSSKEQVSLEYLTLAEKEQFCAQICGRDNPEQDFLIFRALASVMKL